MSGPCRRCGVAAADIAAPGGRLGCPECYATFRGELITALGARVDSPKHLGLLPTGQPHRAALDHDRARLGGLLDRAVDGEDFETAAILRDQIKDLERERSEGEGA